MAEMSEAERAKFLSRTRLAYLTSLRRDGSPLTIPVWFEWDGLTVRIFTEPDSPKIKRIKRDPRVSLVTSNDLDEYEAWVSFEGSAAIREQGGKELALRLAPRYWDLSDPKRKESFESWASSPEDAFLLIELRPDRIRSERP